VVFLGGVLGGVGVVEWEVVEVTAEEKEAEKEEEEEEDGR
jgi:hypothetical protein